MTVGGKAGLCWWLRLFNPGYTMAASSAGVMSVGGDTTFVVNSTPPTVRGDWGGCLTFGDVVFRVFS